MTLREVLAQRVPLTHSCGRAVNWPVDPMRVAFREIHALADDALIGYHYVAQLDCPDHPDEAVGMTFISPRLLEITPPLSSEAITGEEVLEARESIRSWKGDLRSWLQKGENG